MAEAELAPNQPEPSNFSTNGTAIDTAGVAGNSAPPHPSQDDLDSPSKTGDIEKSSSYLVLEKNMLFWDQKGDALYDLIKKYLEADGLFHNRNNANLIVTAAKALSDAKSKAVDAAAKLIAYQKPKLTAIDVNTKTEHRFVINAPPVHNNSTRWLEEVAKEQVVRTIMNPPTLELAASGIGNKDDDNSDSEMD